MIEWVFYVIVLTGDVREETGWQETHTAEVSRPDRAACEAARAAEFLRLRGEVGAGGGVVVTGCRERGRGGPGRR